QRLDLAIKGAAPIIAGKEGPADLDLAHRRVITVIAARPDDPASLAIENGERRATRERAVEIIAKDGLGITIGRRMNRPDQWIGGGREHPLPVACLNWPKHDMLA